MDGTGRRWKGGNPTGGRRLPALNADLDDGSLVGSPNPLSNTRAATSEAAMRLMPTLL
jgi:hypothetical protein